MPDSAGWEAAFPYQRAEIERTSRRRNSLTAFEQGLGKTLTAILAARRADARSLLVLAPAVAGVSWRQQARFWAEGMSCVVIERPDDIPSRGDGIYVISYDKAIRPEFQRRLMARTWHTLVLDESHYLKNRATKRTRMVFGPRLDGVNGLISRAERVHALSGTPAPNHAGELYPLLRALAPRLISDPVTGKVLTEQKFVERYCEVRHSQFGMQVVGSKNQAELRRRISPFMARATKESVGLDLPPLLEVDLPLEPDPGYATSLAAFDDEVRRLIRQNPGAELLDLLNREGMHLATRRRELGLAKAGPAADWVECWLDGGGPKLLVFAQHLQVLDILQRRLTRRFGVVRVDGSTSLTARETAIQAFQESRTTRVFLGQLKAASTAITLTAAQAVLIVEPDWTPSVNAQAVARAHRLGQENHVTAYFAVAAETLDESITRVCRRKAADLKKLIA